MKDKKILNIILWIVGIVFAIRWLNKHKEVAKKDPYDPLNLLPIGSIEWKEVSDSFGESLTESRKRELSVVADEIYDSVKGMFMKKQDFIQAMLKIRSDLEFAFVEKVFGKRKNKGLRQWIEKELLITNAVKQQVNNEYMLKGMQTRI